MTDATVGFSFFYLFVSLLVGGTTSCLIICCCCCPSRRSDNEENEVETGATSWHTNIQTLAERHRDIEQNRMESQNSEEVPPAHGRPSLPDQVWSTGLEYGNESQEKKDVNIAPPSYDEAIQSWDKSIKFNL